VAVGLAVSGTLAFGAGSEHTAANCGDGDQRRGHCSTQLPQFARGFLWDGALSSR
jgi:hypothetical protein